MPSGSELDMRAVSNDFAALSKLGFSGLAARSDLAGERIGHRPAQRCRFVEPRSILKRLTGMTGMRGAFRAPLLLVVGLATGMAVSGAANPLPAGKSVDEGAITPFVVNAGSGDEFAPAVAGSALAARLTAGDLLTSWQAVAAFRTQDPLFNPPGDVAYQLGTLTQSPDDQTAVPPNTAVWALTWHQCPENHSGAAVPADDSCTEWFFLNARTGHMIAAESQEPSGTDATNLASLGRPSGDPLERP